jgi:hypothetical protein
MGTKLKTFDWTPQSNVTAATSKRVVYPWDDWFDGDIWQLTEGVDFDTPALMMERIVRTRATAVGAKVRMRHQPSVDSDKYGYGTLILQRTDIKGPGDAKKAEAAAKRAAKRVEAEKAARKTLKAAGIKPVKRTAARNGQPVKHVSKRPAKKVAAR